MQRKSIGLIFEILSNQYKKIYEEFDIKKNIKINIIGEKENDNNMISLRSHGGKDYGMIKLEKFIQIVNQEINNV